MDAGYLIVPTVCTWFFSKLIIKYQKALKLVDDPKLRRLEKNTHNYPVPRGGGISTGLGIIVTFIIFGGYEPKIWLLIPVVFVIMAIGYLDDRVQDKISPIYRLLVNMFIGVVVWYGNMGIKYVTGLDGQLLNLSPLLGLIATVLWLTWMQNIVGWSSGVDGQLPGFVAIAALMVGVWGANREGFIAPDILRLVALATCGAYLGFLKCNWYPQKIMPGYGGKSLAGFLLGLIAILADVKLGTMAMVLAIPFTDAAFAIIKRLSEGRPAYLGGKDHLHHFLLDRGWNKKQVAVFYWMASLTGGIISLQLKGYPSYFTMATVILVFAGLVLWLRNWPLSSKLPDRDSGLKT